MQGITVLVCGGRHYQNRYTLDQVLDDIHANYRIDLVIHGAAKGADSLAADWAFSRGVSVISCPADWEKHGKAAGSKRNVYMLTYEPDLVVAFSGSKGTENMKKLAKKESIPVKEVS